MQYSSIDKNPIVYTQIFPLYLNIHIFEFESENTASQFARIYIVWDIHVYVRQFFLQHIFLRQHIFTIKKQVGLNSILFMIFIFNTV